MMRWGCSGDACTASDATLRVVRRAFASARRRYAATTQAPVFVDGDLSQAPPPPPITNHAAVEGQRFLSLLAKERLNLLEKIRSIQMRSPNLPPATGRDRSDMTALQGVLRTGGNAAANRESALPQHLFHLRSRLLTNARDQGDRDLVLDAFRKVLASGIMGVQPTVLHGTLSKVLAPRPLIDDAVKAASSAASASAAGALGGGGIQSCKEGCSSTRGLRNLADRTDGGARHEEAAH